MNRGNAILICGVLFACSFLSLSDSNSTSSTSEEKDYSLCLKKYDSKWGEECKQCTDSHKSYRVSLRNTCTESIDVKCAVQEADKRWKTFTSLAMAANDTLVAYACNGVGKYRVWARKAGDRINEFPTDEQINREYSK